MFDLTLTGHASGSRKMGLSVTGREVLRMAYSSMPL